MPAERESEKIDRPWILLFLCCLIASLFILAACSPAAGGGPENDRLDVIATSFPPFDFARQVGGEHVQVTMLLPPGSESHTYEPSPKDLIRIKSCDLFIYNGGISDTWVDRLLAAAEIEADRTVRMMDYVALIEEAEDGVLQAEEHGHDDHSPLHHYDEHIWTDPMNALRIAEGIADRMEAADPGHAADYRANVTHYAGELRALDQTFKSIIDTGPRREIIVADRFPLIYFTSAYDLDYMAAFPGCAAETDPKPRTVAAIIQKVRDQGIPYIFHIEFSNEKLVDLVAEETGARKLLFHTAHNVSKEEIESGVTYLSIMQDNADRLRQGLGR